MIIQTKRESVREEGFFDQDIEYLKSYYDKHGVFPMFQQVLIETRTDCNNRCPFCVQRFQNKPLGIMTWDVYCRTIDNLVELGYNGRVALVVSNEPLLDETLIEKLKYAKGKSQRLFMDITSNGRLLTPDYLDKLFEAGLDNINVDDYRSDRDKFPDKLSGDLEAVHNAYYNNPKINIRTRRTDEKWPNYAGNIPQDFNPDDYGFCNFPFRKLVVAYNGDILQCCDDFMYDTCFGNVMNEDLLDCWNKEEFNKIRLSLLENKRIGMCARCNDSQNYKVYS